MVSPTATQLKSKLKPTAVLELTVKPTTALKPTPKPPTTSKPKPTPKSNVQHHDSASEDEDDQPCCCTDKTKLIAILKGEETKEEWDDENNYNFDPEMEVYILVLLLHTYPLISM